MGHQMKVLVTGGCGFIGSNFVRYMLERYPSMRILNLDKLTYAGNPTNLRDIESDDRYSFVRGDICFSALVKELFRKEDIDTIVHFAAESHVDRSIADPSDFIRTNVLGTFTLLDAALSAGIDRFIHVSTDEVYGSIMEGSFRESDVLNPSSPYSSSKASSDLIARSYFLTYNLPVIVTRCTNNYGPYQYPEKLIPLFITNLMEGKKVPVYGSGKNVRDWIHVLDHCRAIDYVLQKGTPGNIYNIGSGNELSNIDITRTLLGLLEKGDSWIEYVKDRPGHDFRYSLDSAKLRSLGWKPAFDFEQGLRDTVEWYIANQWWWYPLKHPQTQEKS
jgi:dTDP-glucose 4,6-dehydratase